MIPLRQWLSAAKWTAIGWGKRRVAWAREYGRAFVPVQRARWAGAAGKIRTSFDVAHPVHLNFQRGLLTRLGKDRRFAAAAFCAVSLPPGDSIPAGVAVVNPYRLLEKVPCDFLITCRSQREYPRYPGGKTVHLMHTLASAHVVFPPDAFDGFDYIFCAGPHHVQELKALLGRRAVQACTLIPLGSEIVDRLIRESGPAPAAPDGIRTVFAPSWGPDNALVRHGERIVEKLIEKGPVCLRPHPMSLVEDKPALEALLNRFGSHPRFRLDTRMDSLPALLEADALISDWSGIAFEFALGRLRPVVFIDGPMKVFNADWSSYLDRAGVECTYRDKVGCVLTDPDDLPEVIREQQDRRAQWAEKIRAVREELLFFPGRSAEAGVRALQRLSERQSEDGWVSLN